MATFDSMDEFEQALGDGEGQGRLESCSPWGCKESDTAERLNNNNVCVCVYMYKALHYYAYNLWHILKIDTCRAQGTLLNVMWQPG